MKESDIEGFLNSFSTNTSFSLLQAKTYDQKPKYNYNIHELGLHVEGHWLDVGHRAHSSYASHHFALNIFQRLALSLWHVEYYEEQTYHANRTEEPKGAMISDCS